MSWSVLPDDVVHVILDKVRLIDLARITTACTSFRAAYRRRMGVEEEARRQLAVNTFGAARIACILDLTVRLLKKEPLLPGLRDEFWDWFRIHEDGFLHGPLRRAPLDTPNNGDIDVWLWRTKVPCLDGAWGGIDVTAPEGEGTMQMKFRPLFVDVEVIPTNDEDLVPMALVQALLGGGLARIIRDVGAHAEVRVGRFEKARYTQTGLKVQIAPLSPFGSQYTPVEKAVGHPVPERMWIWQVYHRIQQKSIREKRTAQRPHIKKALEA